MTVSLQGVMTVHSLYRSLAKVLLPSCVGINLGDSPLDLWHPRLSPWVFPPHSRVKSFTNSPCSCNVPIHSHSVGFGVVVDGSDIDERVLPMGPKVVEIGANVLSLAVVDLDVVAMLESGVTDSACTASSVVLLGWSEFSETSSVWIILACAELVPSGVPASVDAEVDVPAEELEFPSVLLIAFPVQISQLTGQKWDNFTPFSSVLHIVTFSPSPKAAAS